MLTATNPNTSKKRSNGRGRFHTMGRKSTFQPQERQVSSIDRAHLQALLEERMLQIPLSEPHRAGYQRTLERITNGEETAFSVAEALNNAVTNCLYRYGIVPYGS